ncbi:hypothetical protein QBC45DRAFT_445592 [Copromyces sp. CBS 386.78]|nr:hypothetical protein QBC45DRAFT_445592 [Copromyces sp. CBS 386.78]
MPATSTSNVASFTRSVLGPLTTTFTAPPDCCTQCYELAGGEKRGNTCRAYAEDCLGIPRASCLPQASNAISDVELPWGFFSPGLACPSGWTTAGPIVSYGQMEKDGGGVGNIVDVLEAGETAGFCCPSGFNLELTYPPEPTRLVAPMCYSRMEAGTYRAWGCETNINFEGQGEGSTQSSQYSAIVTNADFAKCLPRCPVFDPPLIATATSQAPAVQLVWRERDRRNTVSGTDRNIESESESEKAGSGNTAPRTTASTSPPSSESSQAPPTDQISTGSGSKSNSDSTPPTGRNIVLIVVLSVGIPLLLFLAGGCFGIRWYRRRKRAQVEEQRRDQEGEEQLRLAEESITYYNNKKSQGQGQNPSIRPQSQPQQHEPLPAASPSKVVPEIEIEIEIAAHNINDRPGSKAELDAVHTARARTARHPSENFADPRVELDAVGTARAVHVDEEARGKRRTWERQELDAHGEGFGFGSGAGSGQGG